MTIDLARLPAPSFVEAVSFEALLEEMKQNIIALNPDLEPVLQLESEPLVILLQVVAYGRIADRTRHNQVGTGSLLAFAEGSVLDHLGASLSTGRRSIPDLDGDLQPESDAAFRARIQSAFERLTSAGPRSSYEAHAVNADEAICDARAHSPAPGEVVVTILPAPPANIASEDLIAKVFEAVGADDVRPLTDSVTVQTADIKPVQIEATLYVPIGPDRELVLAEARKDLDSFIEDNRQIGRTFSFAGLAAALHRNDVARVEIRAPLGDIVPTDSQVCVPESIALSIEASHT